MATNVFESFMKITTMVIKNPSILMKSVEN